MTKKHWEKQAKKYKNDTKAVNFDILAEDLEITFLDKLVGDGEMVCDIGCGNGRTLIELAKKNKKSKFYGLDFAKEMINVANENKKKVKVRNVFFYNIDATLKELPRFFNFKFDKIITKRLLINLKGIDKYKAIESIYSLLKEGGNYLMIECFIEPLGRINKIRKNLGLKEIKVRKFNEYLSFKFLEDIRDKFIIEKKIDFESLYYFISRIFNAYLSEGEPDYLAPINKLAVNLIKKGINPIKDYAPEIIFILKKK